MANKLFGKGAEKTLNKLIDWDTDDLRVIAMLSSYTFDQTNDEFLSDLSGDTTGTAVALTSKSITGGVFDADDISYVLGAVTVKGFVIYLHTGTGSTSPLLGYIDNILGFPLTTSGGTIPIQWSNGAGKIMSLLG